MQAKIIKIEADLFTCEGIDNSIYKANASKLFKLKSLDFKVGDNVELNLLENNKAYITKRYDRRNDLVRPQVANIDKAIICVSVLEPDLNLNLLDKFLCILEYSNIESVIFFTKYDLLKETKDIDSILKYYQSIGYECYKTTTKNNDIIKYIYKIVDNKVVVITGQSGVGKSSLINLVDPSLNLKTDEISISLNRGKHTTRFSQLIKLGNGWIIDTPGFGNIDLYDLDNQTLSHQFREFFEASKKCKYKGCLHLDEPNCYVKELVNKGVIKKSRYDSYKQFIKLNSERRK